MRDLEFFVRQPTALYDPCGQPPASLRRPLCPRKRPSSATRGARLPSKATAPLHSARATFHSDGSPSRPDSQGPALSQQREPSRSRARPFSLRARPKAPRPCAKTGRPHSPDHLSLTLQPSGCAPGRPDAPCTLAPPPRRFAQWHVLLALESQEKWLRANRDCAHEPATPAQLWLCGRLSCGTGLALRCSVVAGGAPTCASGHRPCYRVRTYHTLCIRSLVPRFHIYPDRADNSPLAGPFSAG